MAGKSPFANSFVQVRFVWGPDLATEQHIFETVERTRVDRSMCGQTDHEIHHNDLDKPDVTVSLERDSERPLCAACEKKWKNHPRSPWKAWGQKVKVQT